MASTLQIVMLGDSLTTGFCLSSPLSMFWSARRKRQRSWFYDETGSIASLVQQLERDQPVIADSYATVSAKVDTVRSRSLLDRCRGSRHLSEQVNQVRCRDRFPD